MKIISIRAPWHWFILHGGKTIENRDWSTKYRGPILIHAGKWFDPDEVVADAAAARDMMRAAGGTTDATITLGDMRKLCGHIVGRADLVDCVAKSTIPWFMGDYGFVLANARPLAEPIPFKAQLGLFDAPQDILDRIAT